MTAQYCSLDQKTAIITGASRGIGKAIAIQLASCGAKISLVARNQNKLIDVQDQDFADVKKKMGFEPWEWSDSFGFASTLTKELKKLKYDGVISDKEAEGILIFDEKNVEEVK